MLPPHSTPSTHIKFANDGWRPVAELNGSTGAVIRSYCWGKDLSGSLEGAGGIGGLLMVREASATHAARYDANGNLVGFYNLTDDNIALRLEYGPYGQLLTSRGYYTSCPFRFSTKYQDAETGLYYFGYRYYSVETGTWLNRDLIGERGGDNLYEGMLSAPTTVADPLGLAPNTCMFLRRVTEPNWNFVRYDPRNPDPLATKLDKSGSGVVTAAMRAIYVKRYRDLFACCDACDSGRYFVWGPFGEVFGHADVPDKPWLMAPARQGQGRLDWLDPQEKLPKWNEKGNAPVIQDTPWPPNPPTTDPRGRPVQTVITCSYPPVFWRPPSRFQWPPVQ